MEQLLRKAKRHGRPRLTRGVLKSFDDLPIENRDVFKKIKEVIRSKDNGIEEVYVFGSFHWGNWDNESDRRE